MHTTFAKGIDSCWLSCFFYNVCHLGEIFTFKDGIKIVQREIRKGIDALFNYYFGGSGKSFVYFCAY